MNYDDRVMSAPIDPRFRFIVNDILRDKASGWIHDYFGTVTSPWHTKVLEHQRALKEMDDAFKSNLSLTKTLEAKIKASDIPKDEEGHKALSKKEKTEIQSSINDLITKNANLVPAINRETLEYDTSNQFHEIFLSTSRQMQYLCGKFRTDQDQEFLERGISMVYTEHYYRLDKPIPTKKESAAAW